MLGLHNAWGTFRKFYWLYYFYFILFIYFFYLGFLSRTFMNHRTTGEGGGHFFISSLPLPPASQTLRYWPSDYCRELISAHSQQPDSNQEPLISKHESLTTKLRTLNFTIFICTFKTDDCLLFMKRFYFTSWKHSKIVRR